MRYDLVIGADDAGSVIRRAMQEQVGGFSVNARYDAAWKPELHAVSWISQKTLFENPLNTLRSMLTMALGQNVVGEAKRTDMS